MLWLNTVHKIAVCYVGGNVMSVVMFGPDRSANVPTAPEAGGECHHWSSLLHMHHDSTPVSDWKENVCQFKSHHCKCCYSVVTNINMDRYSIEKDIEICAVKLHNFLSYHCYNNGLQKYSTESHRFQYLDRYCF